MMLFNLQEKAKETRRRIIKSLFNAQSGHAGPSLSVVEILITLLFEEMDLEGNDRDRFILSKGHGVPAWYAALSLAGYLPEEKLSTLRQIGSPLQGHPVRGTLPLIDASTGSLGQGFSVGIGYALAMRLKHHNRRVYVVVGDGESQEGQIWEAAMAAAKFKLSNILVIIDFNKIQNEAFVDEQMPLEPFGEKWASFGWQVQELDGHDMGQLLRAYEQARRSSGPTVIIAHTIKGKGVSFMEGSVDWHSCALGEQEYKMAIKELSE